MRSRIRLIVVAQMRIAPNGARRAFRLYFAAPVTQIIVQIGTLVVEFNTISNILQFLKIDNSYVFGKVRYTNIQLAIESL